MPRRAASSPHVVGSATPIARPSLLRSTSSTVATMCFTAACGV
jgi:hypothetical protein